MSNRWRNGLAGLVSLAVFASVLALAIQADGREATRATSNDGGAWLVDRSKGGVAHVEYTTRQPTVAAQVAEPGSALSALQSPGIVLLHDRSTDTVKVVDNANAAQVSTTSLPAGSVVKTSPAGAAVFDPARSQLWQVSRGELTSVEEIDTVSPSLVGDQPGELLVGIEGQTVVLSGSMLLWPSAAGEEPASFDLPDGFEPDFLTMAASQVVLVDDDRWFVATAGGGNEIQLDRQLPVLAMQREAASWPRVGVTSQGGEVFYVDVSDGSVVEVGEGVDAAQTGQSPINHEDCVHTLGGSANAMDFAVLCADGRREIRRGLEIPAESELRLVNGEVWIDALDGSGFLLTPELELQDVADFSEIFDNADGEESADGDRIEERLDQSAENAGLTEADKLDERENPLPPVAQDDEAATRLGRSVVVDVLANDSDPNGDVILVDDIEILDGGDLASVVIPTSADGVQVTPGSLPGTVRFRYSINDGNGGSATALVEVQLLPLTQDENRPPTAVLDRVRAAAGSTATVNLLENDFDPDGDSIYLSSIGETDGVSVLSKHPDGTVFLALPPTVESAEIELDYVIVDEWQAEQEGTLRITLRLDDSNAPPDARNDAGTTEVGRSITLFLLSNDIDPDNDALSIGVQPRLVDGGDIPGFTSTSADGEFLFRPTQPGVFVFEYAATDLTASDAALVRIEVTEATENRAPVAVRDDVTLALNETRLVRALDNDGDLDGDLFGFSDIGVNPNLDIRPIAGSGFEVTMRADAGRVETFDYRITDGQLESESTQVVVVRSDAQFEDAPPVALPDTVRVRPGRTSRAFVLRNDFDPEGLALTIIDVDPPDGIDASIGGNGAWLEVRAPVEQTLPVAVQYTVSDEADQVASAPLQLVMVREDEPNTPPVPRTDVAYTFEGQSIAINVIANDFDPESDGFSVTAIPNAALNGSAEVNPDGASVSYTPAPNFAGTDEFTYAVRDTEGDVAVGLVRVGVMPIPKTNNPPIAGDDDQYDPFPADGSVAVLKVLENDIDPDGDPLEITEILTDGSEARIAASRQQIQYQLPEGISEPIVVTFAYRISDGRLGVDDAIVQFTIEPIVEPEPPVANPDVSQPVSEGESVTIRVVDNDVDPDGDDSALRIVSIDPSAAGTFTARAISLTAPAETSEIRYTIEDEDGLQASSFVTVEVKENLPPEVNGSISLGPFFTDEVIPTINLADYVSDQDNSIDELVFAGVAGASGGTTRLNPDAGDSRQVTFEPTPDFDGEGGFSFTVQDPAGNLASGWVSIALQGPSNRPPVASDQVVSIEAGVDRPLDVASLFEDPDTDQALTYERVSEPGNQLSLEGGLPNLTLIVPVTALAGETAFSIRATDPEGETALATVTVTISETQTGPPVTGTIPDQEINQGQSAEIRPLDFATDTLGEGLVVSSASILDATAGTVSHTDTVITFQSSPTFSGTAVIQYTVKDAREGEGGESTGSAAVVVVGRPDAPTGVEAEADGPTSVVVRWRVPGDNGGPIERYRVRLNGAEIREHDSTSPTVRFDDLTPGEAYSFEIIAVNKAGESDSSPASAPVTPDEVPGPPGTPVATFVVGEPGAIQVDWTASENRGSAIEAHTLEVSLCSSAVRELGDVTSFKWTGLPDGQPCSFRVTSRNKAGDSLPSQNSDVECAVDVPAAPGQPTYVRGDKQVDVGWNAPTNPDCQPIVGYEIIRYLNGAEEERTSVPFGTNAWTSAPLVNGETYSFAVRAENRQGWGDPSPISTGPPPCGEPLQTAAPSAEPGDMFATVTRTEDADANGCAVTQYLVRVNGGAEQALPANGVLPNLTNGSSYTFSVAGVNEIGTGEFSPESAAVIPFGLPGVPTIGTATPGGATIQVSFSGADNNGSAISTFAGGGDGQVNTVSNVGIGIECINNLGLPCLPSNSGQKSPRTSCLQNAETVSIEGWAVNAAGAGERAVWTTTLAGCPSQPGNSASAGNGQYTVTWTRPSGSQIWVERNGSLDGPVSGTSKTYSGNNGTSYTIYVWACNGYGCARSAVRTARPEAPDPRIVITWGTNVGQPTGCNNEVCFEMEYTMTDFAPNRTYEIECRTTDSGLSFRNTSSRTDSAGDATGETTCYFGKTFAGDEGGAFLRIDGVDSNKLTG